MKKEEKKKIHNLPLTKPSQLVLVHQVVSLLILMAWIRGPENRICKLKRISIWTYHETKGGRVEEDVGKGRKRTNETNKHSYVIQAKTKRQGATPLCRTLKSEIKKW